MAHGELLWPVFVRRPSSDVRRPSIFALNNISSETSGQILNKFVLNHPGTDVYKSCSNHDHRIKIKVTVDKNRNLDFAQ
jgi:hypothetical protein